MCMWKAQKRLFRASKWPWKFRTRKPVEKLPRWKPLFWASGIGGWPLISTWISLVLESFLWGILKITLCLQVPLLILDTRSKLFHILRNHYFVWNMVHVLSCIVDGFPTYYPHLICIIVLWNSFSNQGFH